MIYFDSYLFTAPSGPPTSLTAVATSSSSIDMTWAPPTRDQQNGIIRHYLVTLVPTTVSAGAETLTRNVSSVQQAISISGLQPYTLYNCTVQAETVELGPSAPVVQASTPQDGTCKRLIASPTQ